jgi:DNA-nicking Smr family endonuclease
MLTEASRKGGQNSDIDEAGLDGAELWHKVAATVKPYTPKKAPQKPEKQKLHTSIQNRTAEIPSFIPKKITTKKIDAGVSKDLKRKKFSIDAKIDLHGMTEKNAYQKLMTFVTRCLAQEKRTILVITGKGAGGQGILKKNAPLWLETEFAGRLLALSEAPIDMGGSGAFLARFRKS